METKITNWAPKKGSRFAMGICVEKLYWLSKKTTSTGLSLYWWLLTLSGGGIYPITLTNTELSGVTGIKLTSLKKSLIELVETNLILIETKYEKNLTSPGKIYPKRYIRVDQGYPYSFDYKEEQDELSNEMKKVIAQASPKTANEQENPAQVDEIKKKYDFDF